ncbi:MAG: SpoIIE family protein phosphatase [Bacteroidetes bacterium]|nr:SpoIIE family protein phosphatase [Bacteroidota bacterium]
MIRKLFTLLFLSFSFFVHAQTTSFINYGVEQGLVQSQVQTLVQDDNGNLWIGTLAGLSKYNGLTFQNFSKKDGLAEDWITASYKDAKGDIWFGHWAGGVSRYNVKSGKFESLNLEEYTRFHTVTAITEDEQGYFWIATEGSGIFIYDPAKNKMFALNVKDGLASSNVYDLAMDKSSNMWIATDHGLTICDTKGDISSPASYVNFNAARGFASDVITALELSKDGSEMWIGTGDKGAVVLQLPSGFVNRNVSTLAATMKVFGSAEGTGSDFINEITQDTHGNFWLGTTGGGAVKISPAVSTNNLLYALDHAVVKEYNTRQGLNYFNVNCMLEDREGNVWLGTDVGLNQYRGERFQLFDRLDQLNNDIVWATCVDHDGNVWLGTNDGLTKLTFYTVPETGEKKFTTKNYSTADGLGTNVILSLFEDESNTLWVGTGYGGVSRLSPGSDKFETFSTKDGLAGDVVYAINSDGHGNIWIGTKEGASRFDPLSKTFRNYTIEDGLGGNNVYRIFRDSRGTIWFGSLGGYLSAYDGKAFTKYDESSGIVHRFILTINEDKDHNIWFGAYGGGIYEFDGRTFKNYTMKNGMSTDSPYAIICDNDNNIWVGNSRGLDRFVRKDSSFIHYGKSEGFLGVEVNPNAASLGKDGALWFGTIMGAVKFDPKEDRKNETEPLTFINGLKIFMRDADFPQDGKFSYDQNHITFQFVGISLTNPEKVKYQYKLEGFDKDWSPLPTHYNEAVYSNLPPGEYSFLVKACNNDGKWNAAPVVYKFFIRPPFWQTATFYVIMILFVLFCIYGFDKWRTTNLKKQKKILEEKVEERTLELALKNEELAQKNKEVTDSIKYAKRLQDTMLLPSRELRKQFTESFILYKPKDIVSGDFYFYRLLNANGRRRALISAVDCTGHGVPGAFMSIFTNDLILQILEANANATPAKMLDELNKAMSEKMRHTIDDIQVRDGVDISLASIDVDSLEMKYAGAFNSIYMFRGKQFHEYKADKISIGGFKEESAKNYSDTTVQLQSGDTIYLFSDGYADQFGGPQGKKFKLSQMKALLLNMQDQEMIDQHRILDQAIENWKGTFEQVDDMLVIGIRV